MNYTRVKLDRFLRASERIIGPRVLVTDIETFPIIAYVWGLFKQNVGVDMIAQDWSMMSFAAKWLGQPELFYTDNRDRADPRDDMLTLAALHRILSVTDVVIAHNGQKFDVPKIKARFVQQGLPPTPPFTVLDTLLLNRKTFGFASQRLAFITKALVPEEEKDDHKNFPGFKLWLGCMAHDKKAWRECEAYNIQDVLGLEASYIKTRGWYEGAPNYGPHMVGQVDDGEHVCPTCGSSHVIEKGTRKTQVGIYKRYKCMEDDCGKWSRGRLMVVSKADRAHILVG